MIDKSGYGKLRDIYKRATHDSSYKPDFFNDVPYNYQLEENIKSKYIEYDPYYDPIIASKSISLKNNINKLRVGVNENSDSSLDYTYHESNIYPCRNHDLLDVSNRTYSALSNNNIFYDKLIMYSNNKLFPFNNYGPLYNIAPENTPVLTKMIESFNQKKDGNKEIVINITCNSDNLSDILTVENIFHTVQNHNKSNSIIIFNIIYKIHKHFRKISGADVIDINAYIPECLVSLTLSSSLHYMQSTINNYMLNPENHANYNTPILKINGMSIATILDQDLSEYIVWKYNERITSENDNKGTGLYNASSFEHDIIYKSGLKQWRKPKIIKFPFGNVYYTGAVCNSSYKMTELALDVKQIIDVKNNTIDISNVINSSYSDFFDSRFNSDLKRYNFILKDDYERFLNFKYSMDKETYNKTIIDMHDKCYRKIIKKIYSTVEVL